MFFADEREEIERGGETQRKGTREIPILLPPPIPPYPVKYARILKKMLRLLVSVWKSRKG